MADRAADTGPGNGEIPGCAARRTRNGRRYIRCRSATAIDDGGSRGDIRTTARGITGANPECVIAIGETGEIVGLAGTLVNGIPAGPHDLLFEFITLDDTRRRTPGNLKRT